MKTKRKKRASKLVFVRTSNEKHLREWRSECGHYRITWRDEFGGVSVPPRYHACVLSVRPTQRDYEFWGFAGPRRPFKTSKRASEVCSRNKRCWQRFVKLSHSKGNRIGRLSLLQTKAKDLLKQLPKWAHEQAEPNLIFMNFGLPRP